MDQILLRALAAAARAFAGEIERSLGAEAAGKPELPVAGSPASMLEVLRSVAAVNDGEARGATDEDIRAIARRAGIDPRGTAGYYAARLLERREDGSRWLSPTGRERLQALSRVVLLDAPRPAPPGPEAPPPSS